MMQSKGVEMINGFRNFLAVAFVIGFSPSIHAQAAGQANLSAIHPVATCAALASLSLEAIAGAGNYVTAAQETSNNDIPVCSTTGTLAPEVNFQALLPLHNRTQRYLQVGWGGLFGNITLGSGASDGCAVLNDGGFVMAATDLGHSDMGADWGQNATISPIALSNSQRLRPRR